MTEAEWNACADPEPMLLAISLDACQREMRLFAAACVRRVWHLLPYASRKAIETAEAFAEERCSEDALAKAHDAASLIANSVWPGSRSPDAQAYACSAAVDASSIWPRTVKIVLAVTTAAASAAASSAAATDERGFDVGFALARRAELAAQAALLRAAIVHPATR